MLMAGGWGHFAVFDLENYVIDYESGPEIQEFPMLSYS